MRVGIPENLYAVVGECVGVRVVVIGEDVFVLADEGDVKKGLVPEHLHFRLLRFALAQPGELKRRARGRYEPILVIKLAIDDNVLSRSQNGVLRRFCVDLRRDEKDHEGRDDSHRRILLR